jgi:hypothetical protein
MLDSLLRNPGIYNHPIELSSFIQLAWYWLSFLAGSITNTLRQAVNFATLSAFLIGEFTA